jgi:hypothetical protein
MFTNLRIVANTAAETVQDYPWTLVSGSREVGLFKNKKDAQAIIQLRNDKRRMEDDSSRYRAMYLGAAAYRPR